MRYEVEAVYSPEEVDALLIIVHLFQILARKTRTVTV
jgi:hypothetical protein